MCQITILKIFHFGWKVEDSDYWFATFFSGTTKLIKTYWDQANFNLLPKVTIAPKNMRTLQFDNIFI